ncbi:MAG: amidohydrolase family protein [Chitinophagales bacterium]|nr:amidohydrolase family protein [Chitinophagales bacterium]
MPLSEKQITSEVCVHHLYFDADDYATLGNQIKCNPAIKAAENKAVLLQALLDDKLDVIATDHAPHTWQEKSQHYLKAPSGLPLVQHSLNIMLDFVRQNKISIERLVEKMAHAPAQCFQIADRGYIDEGKYADLVLVDPQATFTIAKDNIYYKCGWSPLEGKTFTGSVKATFINGIKAYDNSGVFRQGAGQRLTFDR